MIKATRSPQDPQLPKRVKQIKNEEKELSEISPKYAKCMGLRNFTNWSFGLIMTRIIKRMRTLKIIWT